MKVVDRLLMIVVSFLFFFFTGRCGQVQVSSFRVVGGELSQPGAWPWMTVMIQ